jgi:hypothetical protein
LLAGAFAAGALAAAAFAAGAADFFAAGAFVAGLVFVAVFLAGAFAVVFAWLVVVFLRAVEDTNTSRQGHMGAARPGMVKSRSGHSATDLVASTKRRSPSEPRRGQAGASAAFAARFFSCLNSRTFCSEAGSTTSATERYPSSA